MSLVTIVIVVVTIAGVLLLFLIDDAIDKLIDWFFSLVGLDSGKGPLTAEAIVESERTVLNLVNKGKHKLFLAAIEGRDRRDKRKFPVPYLNENDFRAALPEESARKQFSQVALGPGELKSVILKSSELASLDCQTLAILDSKGLNWPVDGYHVNNIKGFTQP